MRQSKDMPETCEDVPRSVPFGDLYIPKLCLCNTHTWAWCTDPFSGRDCSQREGWVCSTALANSQMSFCSSCKLKRSPVRFHTQTSGVCQHYTSLSTMPCWHHNVPLPPHCWSLSLPQEKTPAEGKGSGRGKRACQLSAARALPHRGKTLTVGCCWHSPPHPDMYS